jgi:hypothetical protein
MYLTTIRVKREGDKPINEQYLVEAVNLTDVEVKVASELEGVDLDIMSCKVYNFIDIFEGDPEEERSLFFEIKIKRETIDDKKVVELYLVEAPDEPTARESFGNRLIEGSIISFVQKPYCWIIR